MTTKNEVGQPILFATSDRDRARIELAKFSPDYGEHITPINLSAFDKNGDLAVYMGLTQQGDIKALAKAILNAVEPEALVENQKDAGPEPEAYEPKPGDRVRLADSGYFYSGARGKTAVVVKRDSMADHWVLDVDTEDGDSPLTQYAPANLLTLIEPDPARPFQVGDLVRVVATQYAMNWGIGTWPVVALYKSGDTVSINHGTYGKGAFTPDELELVKAVLPKPTLQEQIDDLKASDDALKASHDSLKTSLDALTIRVDALETTAKSDSLWGYKVGDRVRYTGSGAWLGERIVGRIERGANPRLRLDIPNGTRDVGTAYGPTEIEKVN